MKNAIYMLKSTTGTQMNSYIITTADGKVIAIDGGFRADACYFIEYLRELTGQQVPHLDGWFLSHAHCDHIDCFLEIVENHRDELTFDKVYYNFPSIYFHSHEDKSAVKTSEEFYRDLPLFADRIHICSGGDQMDIGDAHFDFLYSTDSEFKRNVCNNSSLVFRMILGGKTVMFTGDCGVEAGQKILRLWKDKGLVKSDICQMAHHGQNGCSREFYEAVAPEICLWNTPLWLWNNDAGKGYNTHIWKTVEVRGWMEELGVKENYVIKDGTQVVML